VTDLPGPDEAAFHAQQQDRNRRQTRLFIQLGVGLFIVLAVGVGLFFYFATTHAVTALKGSTTTTAGGPKNMQSGGILMTGTGGDIAATRTPAVPANGNPVATDPTKHSSTVNIVEFIDYQCPYCNQFETANAPQIDKWVAEGKATVEIHPLAFLDSDSQGTRYSSRADNAASCVANYDPDDFLAVTSALYKDQPPEGSPGLPNSKIVSILASAGASDPAIARCVDTEQFRSWVTASTDYAIKNVFNGEGSTPTIFVNGKQYAGSITDPTAFASFVVAHSGVLQS
jgi:protein-disulfide isomerase